ncbi:MAG: ROK family protein [Verrucomicrobiota bacterium]
MTSSTEIPLAIGIDFGGTSIKSALVQGAQILKHGALIDPQNATAEQTLRAIETVIRNLCEGLPQLVPVGIGLPGLVDSTNGIVHGLSNVEGWDEIPVRAILQERLKVPVILENDANAMAYAEWRYGAARNTQNAICITLGTGVGGALILDGKLFRGSQLAAGEIGHASIDYQGKPGVYGSTGGLEEYVGNGQITERADAAYAAAGVTPPAVPCNPEKLAHAAESGCPIATKLWTDIGTEIGAAIASAVWLLNPDAIVIGGGVARAGKLVFDPIRASVNGRTAPVIHQNLKIEPATLGNDAGAIGCAALALDAAVS